MILPLQTPTTFTCYVFHSIKLDHSDNLFGHICINKKINYVKKVANPLKKLDFLHILLCTFLMNI